MEPLTPEHVDRFEPAGHDALSWHRRNIDALKTEWAGRGAAVVEGGRVLALWGLAVEDGVGHIWILLSEEGRRRRKHLHRGALRMVPHLMEFYGLSRVEAEVNREFEAGRRWAERLGFRPVSDGPSMRYAYDGSCTR